MGIKGLTGQGRSFDEIGKLRKGGPKQQLKDKETGAPLFDSKTKQPLMGYGKDLDHFRFDSDDSDATAKFRAAFGEAPQAVDVMLPYPTTEENFMTAMEHYGAGGIEIRCDREWKSGVRVGGRFMKCFPGKVACERREDDDKCTAGCKEVGRLKLIIPALERFVYVTAETHSINDIVRLDKQLADIEHHFGRLNGIPLVLTKRLVSVSTPNGKGRARRPKWLLSLEVSPKWARLQLQSRQNLALSQAAIAQIGAAPQGQAMALPPAPFDTTAQNLRPDPLPTYDFTRSELWISIANAFHTLRDTRQLDAYQAKALGYIDSGELPEQARGMIANLVEHCWQRAADRQTPAPAGTTAPRKLKPAVASTQTPAAAPQQSATTAPRPVIDHTWKKSQLWLDLRDEVMRAAIDELAAYEKQVEKLIADDELPPAAGTEMSKLCNRRASNLQPARPQTVAAHAEVVND
ncbi:MAG: hypothetical protein DCF32_15035 [Leptolyngbya sp.]|nr:MAG: hypothetical protein DCF32_15035 [Leptolyngbya sp.]